MADVAALAAQVTTLTGEVTDLNDLKDEVTDLKRRVRVVELHVDLSLPPLATVISNIAEVGQPTNRCRFPEHWLYRDLDDPPARARPTAARGPSCTHPHVINAVQSAQASTLTTNTGALWKVEVPAKMPTGDWLWPAIWMLPVNAVQTTSKARSTEAPRPRSTASPSPTRGGLRSARRLVTHSNGLDGGVAVSALPLLLVLFRSRHVNGPRRIFVDTGLHTLLDMRFDEPFWKRGEFPETVVGQNGQLEALQDPWVNGTNATPFDQDFYLIMNVAVGGTNGWFPGGQGDKPWLNHAGTATQVTTLSDDVTALKRRVRVLELHVDLCLPPLATVISNILAEVPIGVVSQSAGCRSMKSRPPTKI
ncbi:hypothetical protein DFH06DRAFT_1343154 [Mycena polygramma]|nr:hypothetical protein DFH06DRAFT_1343154 [Mycena polygramma]